MKDHEPRVVTDILNRPNLATIAAIVVALMTGGGACEASPVDAAPHPPVEASSGSVSATENPLVARYSIATHPRALVSVEFGTDTSYPFHTSAISVPNDGQVDLLVAGMKGSTLYHMRAVATENDGSRFVDVDHVFTTGAPEQDLVPNVQNIYYRHVPQPRC